MEPIQKKRILSSLLWKLLERIGVQGAQLIISIILARLLLPEDFGVLALITFFTTLAAVFIQCGFSTALIQKKDADDVDFSSVFYFSLVFALCLYLVIYIFAPIIAGFYQKPIIVPIIRILSITLFFGAINSIQVAVVSRAMQFRRLFFSSLGGVIGSGIAGIALAYSNFGVWALVGQQLTSNILITSILWVTVKWRPSFVFSFMRVKSLLSFGWKLLVSALLDAFFKNIYGLVIGKLYDADRLGFFNQGQIIPSVIASNLDGSIQSVMLPALSSRQDEIGAVKSLMRRSLRTSSYLLLPLMVGLIVVAKPMVSVLLTDKWLECVPFLQMACISFALYPIHTSNLTAINAIGRSDVFLKLEILKKIVIIMILVVSIPFGIYAMAFGQVLSSLIATFINAYPSKKLMKYSYKEQVCDVLPALFLSILMGACVFIVGLAPFSNRIKLLVQITFGIFLYLGVSHLINLESYTYMKQTLKGLRK